MSVKKSFIKLISLISAISTTYNVVFVDVDFEGIRYVTLIHLVFLRCFSIGILTCYKSWAQ